MLSTIILILFLIFMEGMLSLDNALVLAVLVKPLPEGMRKRALTYGIGGAFLFRTLSLFLLTKIMKLPYVKLIGGAYLVFLAAKYFLGKGEEHSEEAGHGRPFSFWRTVLMVELMDIVFSIDSILTAVSISHVYWIILTGGIIGIIMMRFVSQGFVWMLERYPGLEKTAYLLIAIIGVKLAMENFGWNFDGIQSTQSIAYYSCVALSFLVGLKKGKVIHATG